MRATAISETVSEYMARIGRKGGQAKTPKKLKAARRNAANAQKTRRKLFPKD